MNTTIRTTLLTGLFLFGLLSGAQAQEKYEYAVVIYDTDLSKQGFISISKPNSFEMTKVTVELGATVYNSTPVIEVLEKMSNDGWEVYSTDMIDAIRARAYNLKRKKK